MPATAFASGGLTPGDAAILRFLSALETLEPVSIIRPTETEGAAMGALKALTDDGLFRGQSSAFFAFMRELAEAADAARHGG